MQAGKAVKCKVSTRNAAAIVIIQDNRVWTSNVAQLSCYRMGKWRKRTCEELVSPLTDGVLLFRCSRCSIFESWNFFSGCFCFLFALWFFCEKTALLNAALDYFIRSFMVCKLALDIRSFRLLLVFGIRDRGFKTWRLQKKSKNVIWIFSHIKQRKMHSVSPWWDFADQTISPFLRRGRERGWNFFNVFFIFI